MTFDQASWLEVLVDGIAVESGVPGAAGETLRLSGQQTVALRLGNAGAIQIEVNGDDLGLAGAAGELVRVIYGPDARLASVGRAREPAFRRHHPLRTTSAQWLLSQNRASCWTEVAWIRASGAALRRSPSRCSGSRGLRSSGR